MAGLTSPAPKESEVALMSFLVFIVLALIVAAVHLSVRGTV